MKLRVKESKVTEVDVDVTFPIYRKHDLMLDEADAVYFMRVNEDGSELTIRRRRPWGRDPEVQSDYTIEVEHRPFGRNQDTLDYLLGRGEYALTEAEFRDVLDEAGAALKKFGVSLDIQSP